MEQDLPVEQAVQPVAVMVAVVVVLPVIAEMEEMEGNFTPTEAPVPAVLVEEVVPVTLVITTTALVLNINKLALAVMAAR